MTALLAILCCLLWGSAAPFIKLGYRLFSIETTGQILSFAGWRFVLAGVLVLVWFGVREKRFPVPRRKDALPIVALAFFQTAGQYWFYYVGLSTTSGVSAAVLTGSGSLIALLASVFLFRYETLSWNKLAGVFAGLLGIVVLNGWGRLSFHAGELFVLLSQVMAAISAGLIKRFSRDHDPVLLSGWQFFAGGLALACLGGQGIASPAPSGWLDLGYLAFVSAAAYTIWSLLLKRHDMSKITSFEGLIPVAGVFLSAVVLQEWTAALRVETLLALALVCLGIWLVNYSGFRTGFSTLEKSRSADDTIQPDKEEKPMDH